MKITINQLRKLILEQIGTPNVESTSDPIANFGLDQQFSDKDGTYSVKQMIRYAYDMKSTVELPVKSLLHNLETSENETGDDIPGHPLFIKRAKRASLDYPILVVNYDDGLWIADGVHRLWKAVKIYKLKNIKAYVLDKDELGQFKIDD